MKIFLMVILLFAISFGCSRKKKSSGTIEQTPEEAIRLERINLVETSKGPYKKNITTVPQVVIKEIENQQIEDQLGPWELYSYFKDEELGEVFYFEDIQDEEEE